VIKRSLNGSIRASRGGSVKKLVGFSMHPRDEGLTRITLHVEGARAIHVDLSQQDFYEFMRCVIFANNKSFRDGASPST
jgi:hypothetical protein